MLISVQQSVPNLNRLCDNLLQILDLILTSRQALDHFFRLHLTGFMFELWTLKQFDQSLDPEWVQAIDRPSCTISLKKKKNLSLFIKKHITVKQFFLTKQKKLIKHAVGCKDVFSMKYIQHYIFDWGKNSTWISFYHVIFWYILIYFFYLDSILRVGDLLNYPKLTWIFFFDIIFFEVFFYYF